MLKPFLHKTKTKILQHKIKTLLILLLLIGYYFCLPRTLFNEPYSTVIESKEGNLLGAKIARDGQWRFPAADSLPVKFRQCIIAFENQHFMCHPEFYLVHVISNVISKRTLAEINFLIYLLMLIS